MLDNNPALTRHGSFLANGDAVDRAIEIVHDFVVASGCGGVLEAKLAIIVEELVTNLIDHGQCPVTGEIALTVSVQGQGVAVGLSDPGVAFDMRAAPRPADMPPSRGGGAGVAMILAWARIEDYQRIDGRNHLCLVIPGIG